MLLHWQSYTSAVHWQFGEHRVTILVVVMLMVGAGLSGTSYPHAAFIFMIRSMECCIGQS